MPGLLCLTTFFSARCGMSPRTSLNQSYSRPMFLSTRNRVAKSEATECEAAPPKPERPQGELGRVFLSGRNGHFVLETRLT